MLADAVAHTRLGEKTPPPATSDQGASITPAHGPSMLPEARELQELFPELAILELLGAGGMGAVYKARQVGLDRLVAFKVLNPAQDKMSGVLRSEFVERFRREAKAMARLDHPNVVRLYEFGERGGFHFLIMELVDGTNLQKLMTTGKLESSAALDLVPQLCAALHYAHGRGVTHRDIKPANILIDQTGQVKIADFGLARIFHQTHSQVALTNAGQVMGTPFYIAPEQLTSPDQADQRADIYSLGVVVYQILTGQLPQGNFSPPSALQPKLSRAVDHAIMRALAQDPAVRFQDVSELQRAFQTKPSKVGLSSVGGRDKTPMLLGISGLLAVMLLVAAQLHPWRTPSSALPGKGAGSVLQSIGLSGMQSTHTAGKKAIPARGQDISVLQVKKDKPFVNSLGMAFVPVEGTKVLFCVHETRLKDYAAYAQSDPARATLWKPEEHLAFTITKRPEDHPVVSVSWEDAKAFCKWLSEKEQTLYRLPTDHEWSVAVGIGDCEDPNASPKSKNMKIDGAYPWGTMWPPPAGAGNYGDGCDDVFPTTAPVMSFKPNGFGLYDMGGNSWEWVEDCPGEARTERVLRGGSWLHCDRDSLLSSARYWNSPYFRNLNRGFRVVVVTDNTSSS